MQCICTFSGEEVCQGAHHASRITFHHWIYVVLFFGGARRDLCPLTCREVCVAWPLGCCISPTHEWKFVISITWRLPCPCLLIGASTCSSLCSIHNHPSSSPILGRSQVESADMCCAKHPSNVKSLVVIPAGVKDKHTLPKAQCVTKSFMHAYRV